MLALIHNSNFDPSDNYNRPTESCHRYFFIFLFASGHCLPIMAAGSSTAAVRKLMENSAWQGAGSWFRKGAGAVICLLGIYFIVNPFVAS